MQNTHVTQRNTPHGRAVVHARACRLPPVLTGRPSGTEPLPNTQFPQVYAPFLTCGLWRGERFSHLKYPAWSPVRLPHTRENGNAPASRQVPDATTQGTARSRSQTLAMQPPACVPRRPRLSAPCLRSEPVGPRPRAPPSGLCDSLPADSGPA